MDINALLKAQVKENDDLREWTGKIGGEEITLYSSPVSPYDTKTVSKKFPDFENSPSSAAMCLLLALKARDKDDNRVFTTGRDVPLLERLPVVFISEICQELFGDDFDQGDLDLDNLEKNS